MCGSASANSCIRSRPVLWNPILKAQHVQAIVCPVCICRSTDVASCHCLTHSISPSDKNDKGFGNGLIPGKLVAPLVLLYYSLMSAETYVQYKNTETYAAGTILYGSCIFDINSHQRHTCSLVKTALLAHIGLLKIFFVLIKVVVRGTSLLKNKFTIKLKRMMHCMILMKMNTYLYQSLKILHILRKHSIRKEFLQGKKEVREGVAL